jgi:hypothetical protein
MFKIDHCPACNSLDVKKEPAFIHPFVSWWLTKEYVWEPLTSQMVACRKCKFKCSEHRLSPEEQTAYTKGYGGEDYINMRMFSQPWFREQVQELGNAEAIRKRSDRINAVVGKYIDIMKINTVLDYHGGDGKFIPAKFIKSKRYVYNTDTSTRVAPDILSYTKYVTKNPIDLLMCRSVLETKSYMDDVITEIKDISNKDTWLYFEVSNEDVFTGKVFHEQINFFNVISARQFFERHKIEITELVEIDNAICILGKLK